MTKCEDLYNGELSYYLEVIKNKFALVLRKNAQLELKLDGIKKETEVELDLDNIENSQGGISQLRIF